MKKILSTFLVAIALMLAAPANAQLIKFGVKGGVNESKPSYNGNLTGQNYTGFFFGPTAELKIPFIGFGLDGALLYSQKGIDTERGDLKTVRQKEIEIPVNLKYTIGNSLAGIFFFAGPQFAYNMDKHVDDNMHNYTFDAANLSFNFGIGFKLFKHVQLSGNYNLPVNNTATYVDKIAEGQERNCKNKSWQFGAAWFF